MYSSSNGTVRRVTHKTHKTHKTRKILKIHIDYRVIASDVPSKSLVPHEAGVK